MPGHEIRAYRFSGCGYLRFDCFAAVVLYGRADGSRLPTADHSPGVLLRFYRGRCCMATRFSRDVARPGAVPAVDASVDRRESEFRYTGGDTLSPATRLGLHSGRSDDGFVFRRAVFDRVSANVTRA